MIKLTLAMLSIVASMLLSVSALADSHQDMSQHQGIQVDQAWVRLVPPVAKNTAAYFLIHNHASKPDALLSVRADIAAKTTIHGTKRVNGMMRMVEAGPQPISAHGELKFDLAGMHIMLMGLKRPVSARESVILELQFEQAGLVVVEAPVLNGPPVSDSRESLAQPMHHHH